MTNFLVIYVSTESETQNKVSESIYNFVQNLIDQGVFLTQEDRIVVYLEDLYQTETHQTSRIAKDYLYIAFTQMGILNFEIDANTIQQKIVEYCRQNYPLIENHLNFAFDFARAIIAPTLIKELLQQFGLHYETIQTRNTTVYHDLDMRYSVQQKDKNIFPGLYKNAQEPSLAQIDRGFDVFWSINPASLNEAKANLFLNAFYATLSAIISHSNAQSFHPSSYVFPSLMQNIMHDKIMSQQFDLNENLNSQSTTRAIFGLHFGYAKVQNYTPSSDRCRNGFCAPQAYGQPPYKIYPPPSARFIPRAGISGYLFMPSYSNLNAQCTPLFKFSFEGECAQSAEDWRGSMYTASVESNSFFSSRWSDHENETQLKKVVYGKWQQIPTLKGADIPYIIRKYPFMGYILVLTKSLRVFAGYDSLKRREIRQEKNMNDDGWIYFLDCTACKKNFLPTLLPKMNPNSQQSENQFVVHFCRVCLKVFCDSCVPMRLSSTVLESGGPICNSCQGLTRSPSL